MINYMCACVYMHVHVHTHTACVFVHVYYLDLLLTGLALTGLTGFNASLFNEH